MATTKGSAGYVLVGTTAIAELRDYELTEEATAIDDSNLNDDWDTNVVGSKRWSGSASAWFDDTDTNGQEALDIGATATIKFQPEGTASSAYIKQGAAIVTGVTLGASRNNMVERRFSFTGNGTLSQTTV